MSERSVPMNTGRPRRKKKKMSRQESIAFTVLLGLLVLSMIGFIIGMMIKGNGSQLLATGISSPDTGRVGDYTFTLTTQNGEQTQTTNGTVGVGDKGKFLDLFAKSGAYAGQTFQGNVYGEISSSKMDMDVYNLNTGKLCYDGVSSHYLATDGDYRPYLSVRKKYPELYKKLQSMVEKVEPTTAK